MPELVKVVQTWVDGDVATEKTFTYADGKLTGSSEKVLGGDALEVVEGEAVAVEDAAVEETPKVKKGRKK